jgi:hypothetical protein
MQAGRLRSIRRLRSTPLVSSGDMKTMLLIGGVIFLLLGFVLIIAALIAFALERKSRPAEVTATPATPIPPPRPAPMPVTTNATAPGNDATVVVNLSTGNAPGALHGIAGALDGRTFPITSSGFYIGREANLAQVVIADHRVSKRHVWVGMEGSEVVAVDQGSTNGTFLNSPGARLQRHVLRPGDILIISDDVTRLEYRL